MVKVTFNTALAQKDVKKDSETLISGEKDPEEAAYVVRRSCHWCIWLGLFFILSGLLVVGGYLYKVYAMKNEQVWTCGVAYMDEDFYNMFDEEEEVVSPSYSMGLRHINETFEVLQDDEVELITVPVPEFGDSDPADIVHDFSEKLTAYLDLSLDKCYVIPLNTSVVMPPRDLLDLLVKIKTGVYLPQTYLVREEMMVTEEVDDVEQLGFFINRLCGNKETYKLQRRETILGMQKREALNCRKIRHFENEFVMETMICEP
ncbi:integral membrane protein 2Bb isoform X2 [Hoplias malabaricus]|uniref:integral membrane protein 2Bb isoform X2 n=1 Tax=Hoplias malabaricus TaxID=27720 RepID=UPI00346356FA